MSFTRPIENIAGYNSLLILRDGKKQAADIASLQKRGARLLVKLKGIDSPEAARVYIGCDIGMYREALPSLPSGQYYWHQLIGLSVVNLHGALLGKVTDIRETGANDVLVISTDGEKQRKLLIPLVMDVFVKEIDIEEANIKVDWEQEN